MITEDYVSFETAKLLKEKGFDEPTYRAYFETIKEHELSFDVGRNNSQWEKINKEDGIFNCSAPTLQMAMKWLREVHNIAISVYVFNRDIPVDEGNIIYTCDVATTNKTSREGHLRLTGPYEEVCEAAIKYCLENLI